METDQQDLNTAQKELVAVGASVGAGCHPCVAHHLKAGTNSGLDGGQLLAAVGGAERIASEAAVLTADHARGEIGASVTTPAALTPLEDALAAFGAALGSNDASAVDVQLRTAFDLGASASQLRDAIETVRAVQESAARIHARAAERLLDSIAGPSGTDDQAEPGGGCGCGGSDASEAAAQTPAVVGAAGCSSKEA